MKHLSFFIMLTLAAIVCGCNKNNEPTKKPAAKERISVTASINPATRAGLTAGEDGVLKTQWTEWDIIRVYNPAAKDYATFEVESISTDGFTATFTGEIDTEGESFHAVYGISGNLDSETGDYIFRVADKLYYYSQDGNDNIAHLDNFVILHGSFTYGNTSLTFGHTMAFFKFTLTLPDGESIPDGGQAYITIDVPTDAYPTMSITDGSYPISGFEHDLRVTILNLSDEDDRIIGYMAAFPSDVSGRDLTLRLQVNDGQGAAKEYVKTIAAKEERPVLAGHYYTITETMEIPPLTPEGNVSPLQPEVF